MYLVQSNSNLGMYLLDRWSRRKRGMVSNPLFIIPDFFLHFPSELCYGYLSFERNGELPLGRFGKKFAQLAVC